MDKEKNRKLILDDKQQKEIINYFTNIINSVINDRKEFDEEKIPEYWSRYKGSGWSSKIDKDFPWPGSADFNIPFTTWICTSVESRLLNAIFGSVSVARFIATKSGIEDQVDRIQRYFDSAVFRKMEYEISQREGVQRMCVEGTKFSKVVYERDKRILPKYSYNSKIKQFILEMYESVVNGLKKLLPTGKIKIEKNEQIVWEGNKVYIVSSKDMLWWGGDNFQLCDGVAERIYLNIREIQDKVKLEGWFNIEKLYGSKSTVDSKGIEIEKKRESSGFQQVSSIMKCFVLYEIWAYYDIDNCGNVENCRFIIDIDNGVLLHVMENDNFWGMRPYFNTPCFYVSGMVIGQGFPERLAMPSDELNTVHNQMTDNSAAINAFSATVIPQLLGVDLDKFTFKPGTFVPVKNHDAIRRLDFGKLNLDLRYQTEFLKDILQRLAIVTDTSLGLETQIERPTARGKAINLQEFAINFDILIRNIKIGLGQEIDMMIKNLYQYMRKEGIEFPIVDKNGEIMKSMEGKVMTDVLTRQDLEEAMNNMNIEVTASSINAIRSIEIQNAMLLFDKFSGDNTGEINTFGLKEWLINTVDKRVKDKILREPAEILKMRDMIQKMKMMQQELEMQSLDVKNQKNILKGLAIGDKIPTPPVPSESPLGQEPINMGENI